MSFRILNKTVHAYLDYPVAIALIGLPFVLGLGAGNPLALWLSVAAGIAAFGLTVFTDHQFGLVRIIPFFVHEIIDGLVAATFIAAPFVLGFGGIEAAYYLIGGASVFTVLSLTDRPSTSAQAV